MERRHVIRIEIKDAIEFDAAVTLYRGACSCGWRGVWYRDEKRITVGATNHLAEMESRGEV